MKQYPEIPGSSQSPLGKPCIAFYKYDGSNLRFEWSKKQGWHKFGSRTQLFDATHEILGGAIPLFLQTMGDEIAERSKKLEKGLQRVIVFCEYFGPESFAGAHKPGDAMELRLFDVNLYKRGIMGPREFVRHFGDLPYAAQVVYDGNLNRSFIEDVREGKYPVWEGVVAKGEWGVGCNMVKIKTKAYMAKLMEVYAANWRNYWE